MSATTSRPGYGFPTAATQMLAADVSVTAIAEHLGHADLRQISTYAQVDQHHRAGAVDAMDRLVRRHRAP